MTLRKWSGLFLLITLLLRCDWCLGQDDYSELIGQIEELKATISDLTRHVMLSEFQARERVRSEGTSGLVKVRDYTVGPDNFHYASHIGQSFANMHDHANYEKTYGLGDFQVVMNGVHFRTRHNDFELRKASNSSTDWLATDEIELPPLPPGLEALSIEDQVIEMREYLRAFQYQDPTIRDYKPYFKPVLCYMEGWWDANLTTVENGFTSLKMAFNSRTWPDMADKARADAYLGSEYRVKHEDASLPTAIMGVDPVTGETVYGQWNYRVLCHPVEEDIPTSLFKPMEDFAYRSQRGIDENDMFRYKGARYILDSSPSDVAEIKLILDQYVSKIPGLDNVPKTQTEAQFERPDTGDLGFYNRAYGSDRDSLMSYDQLRSFSDGNVFVALNNQERVAPLHVTQCKGSTCTHSAIRASWLIPIEVIYITPLQRWNPYKFAHSNDPDYDNYAGEMDGKSEEKAMFGTHDRFFYRIPEELFGKQKGPTDKIPADSYSNLRYVRNENGEVGYVIASGPRTVLPPIDGVGEIRLRYPIMPVHEEGTSVWKELNGFVRFLKNQFDNIYDFEALDMTFI